MSEFRTAVSVVEPGRVLIRGYSQAEIIGKLPYADATFLTIFGRLPSASEARLTDAMLTSLLDHGWVASTVQAARSISSGDSHFASRSGLGRVDCHSGALHCLGESSIHPRRGWWHPRSRSEHSVPRALLQTH